MISKNTEKQKAIKLRKKGFSYGEILKQVPVAKSTLSLWLRSVGLSKKQEQRLTEKRLAAMKRGWEACRRKRILTSNKIKEAAEKEIGRISDRELWLIGIALYWAEGNKEKDNNIGQGVIFSNSDPAMIKIFLKWLRDMIGIQNNQIKVEIYIHENSKNSVADAIDYWSNIANIPTNEFKYIYFKRNKINTKRKNIGDKYYGLLRVRVGRSSSLNRKISGWVNGIYKNYWGVV